MNQTIQKGLLVLMALLSMYFYYIYYPIHGVVKNHYFVYFIVMAFVYGGYKIYQSFLGENRIVINTKTLIITFLVHFLIVSCFFFGIIAVNTALGVSLFLKISLYLLMISGVWIICYCFGRRLLDVCEKFIYIESNSLRVLVSGALGFSTFILLLFLLTAAGFYNVYAVILLLLLFIGVSFQYIVSIGKSLNAPLKTYSPRNTRSSIALVIDEIQYLVITFLLSVNFISVFRPFPIGWDDLGVYMNFPKLLSGAGELLPLGQMYFWQLYTGIGFLFGSQTFAFLLNSFSGIVVSIVIYLAIKTLAPQQKNNYDFGLLAVIIILMMPMAVFQLAKDMKLDYGLLSISIVAFVFLLQILFGNNKFSHKKSLGSLILVGFFIGIAFSIKLTSLLLLISGLSLLFYKKLGLSGFFSFLAIFVGIFTAGDLWSMMNVLVPETSGQGQNIFSLLSIVIGGGILAFSSMNQEKTLKALKNLAIESLCIVVGFFLALLPWAVKNIVEISSSEGSFSIGTMISGVPDVYRPDYTRIYSPEELQTITDNKLALVSQTGTTSNEDFGRYFGYEQGINNYLKLPWNLTFQTNQKGEFTDITFIFFALIPLIFIVLPYKREIYRWPIVGLTILVLLYCIPSPISSLFTAIFNQIFIPVGYGVIGGFFITPLIYFYYTLDRNNKYTKMFLANYAFSVLYVFLWSISAFGIVWYGILMYFVFILMILLSVIALEENENETHYYHMSYIVLGIIAVYVFQSALPHGINNLKAAGYKDYKLGRMSEEVALMTFHPEYFPIMFDTNIAKDKREEIFKEYRNRLLKTIDGTKYYQALLPQVQSITTVAEIHRVSSELSRIDLGSQGKNNELKNLRQDLYSLVIYPGEDIESHANIYRAGTFMKYFISENTSRLYEDSLIEGFQSYIYSEDPDKIYERFKKLELEYLLIDLNAATIDRDPAQRLTQRYENLLRSFVHPKMTLIETDSICLKTALSAYKLDKDVEKYTLIAGVNYSGKYSSNQKRELCVMTILEVLKDDEKLLDYPHLAIYKTTIQKAGIDMSDDKALATAIVKLMQGSGYKALFRLD